MWFSSGQDFDLQVLNNMTRGSIDFTKYTAVPASTVFSGDQVLPQFSQIVDVSLTLVES